MSTPKINKEYYMEQMLSRMITFVNLETLASSPKRDSFGRQRTSSPFTLFDSKLLGDRRDLFWDDQEVSGSGTGTTYSSARASETLSVSDATAGNRTRQTFQRFNYQPGKSMLINQTFVFSEGASGITRRVGYFNDDNGLFFQQDGEDLSFVIRTKVSGVVVDNVYPQSTWNIDTLADLDITKAQILYIDFESLQVGSVRFGFVIDGAIRYAHVQHHANRIDSAYFSTPNLPLRYEIENDGTGPAATLECICSTVISEGGQEETGVTRSASTEGTHLNANAANTLYALIGYRQKADHLDSIVNLTRFSVLAETLDDFEWQIVLNPTVAGTFTYSDETNSAVQTAKGTTANTVTGGTILSAGFSASNSGQVIPENTFRWIGSAIDGTRDELVLCVRPLSNNADIQGSISWRESS
jgi:hypothetical protein